MGEDIRAADVVSDFVRPVVSCDSNTVRCRVGYFVRTSLAVLERGYSWLAQEVGLDRRTVNSYALGRRIPSEDSFRKIAAALEAPYQTVEDLVNDPDLTDV